MFWPEEKIKLSHLEGVQGRNAKRANGGPSDETEEEAEAGQGEPMDEH